jgi:glycyl-tRNA synthetase beta chain
MASFLLEVGTEELPASFVPEALAQWRSRIPASLEEQFLTVADVQFYGTPRRLAVVLTGLPAKQPDRQEEAKGPAAQAAFKDGNPTKAAEGFARSRGVAVDDLEIRNTEKGEFVFVQQTIPGRPTPEVLTDLVPQWILNLEGKRFMRWGDGDLRFPRPIRWLVTLWNDEVLPITLDNGSSHCQSDRLSQGHRILHPEPIRVPSAEDYVTSLQAGFVEVDPDQRRDRIVEQAQAAAKTVNGVASIHPDLLEEVTDLVEFPTAVVGKFAPEFLDMPSEVVTTVMESHQRYFPVLKSAKSQELLPYFITISNGDPDKSDIIAAGNERVIVARLTDGKFFYDSDRATALEGYLPRLETVTFQEDLGSMRQKVDRIVQVAEAIADQLIGQGKGKKGDRKPIQRAALLCKADLVTQMVGEFPELQGVMGMHYARTSGEAKAVATAIFEHYLPRGADDDLPQTLPGQVVGLADRLDTLASIFSLGMIPSGSSDPFALRRAANAVVNITWAADLPLNLHQLLHHIVTDIAPAPKTGDQAALEAQLQDFFLQRIRTLLQEDREQGGSGIDYDLVNAVLGENDPDYTERALKDLLDVRDRAHFLQSIRDNGTLDNIYETVNRSSRLAAQGDLDKASLDPTPVVQPDRFQSPSEQAFFDALVTLVPKTEVAQAERNYQSLVAALAEIAPVVSNFFDGPESVLVMDKDPAVRQNRLNLLGLLRNHARVLADFGAIVKSA